MAGQKKIMFNSRRTAELYYQKPKLSRLKNTPPVEYVKIGIQVCTWPIREVTMKAPPEL
jgi:hypothetical protein